MTADAVTADAASLADTLRSLAWTIQRRLPERAGVPAVPLTELVVLKFVLESDGPTVGAIAEALDLRQPNASAAVRALIANGLVERREHATDKRAARLFPTARALDERRAIAEAWAGALERAIATLAPGQRRALDASLEALAALDAAMRERD